MDKDFKKAVERIKESKIVDIVVEDSSPVGDQYIRLITDKAEMILGANDLGVWLQRFKEKKNKITKK